LEALRDCFVAASVQGQLLIGRRFGSNKSFACKEEKEIKSLFGFFLDFPHQFSVHVEPWSGCLPLLILDLFAYLPAPTLGSIAV
jgi:hypothetical protein